MSRGSTPCWHYKKSQSCTYLGSLGIKTLPRVNPIQYHITQGVKGSSPCPDIIKNDNPATVASVNAALVINLRGAEEIQKKHVQ
jgi:hypothetical protein